MEFEWDEAKDSTNRAKHGVGLAEAAQMDWGAANPVLDTRQDYGEPRFRLIAPIGKRFFVCVYTLRKGRIRIISLRKANSRERRDHG